MSQSNQSSHVNHIASASEIKPSTQLAQFNLFNTESPKRTQNYSKIVKSIRNKDQLFSKNSKRNMPSPLVTQLNKFNTFHSKRSSPLPPISSSLECNFENYLSVSINKCFKNKVYLKKTRINSHRLSDSFDPAGKLENLMAFGEECNWKSVKSKKNYSKRHTGSTCSAGSTGSRSSKDQDETFLGNIKKLLPKVQKSTKRPSKDSDVQTNDLDFDFHLIYEDEGKVEKLALDQLRQVEFYENFQKVSLCHNKKP
jgi:hypothetical protein